MTTGLAGHAERAADPPIDPQDTVEITGSAVTVTSPSGARRTLDIGSPEAFGVLSHLWLLSGWANKHVYSFTWLGRPIIQLPEDLVRLQEVIYQVRPTVVLETGIAHGGSLMFSASLLKAMGRGRVIAVDREIRPQNRAAIESHELASMITMIEGDSIDPAITARVHEEVGQDDRVMILLDSCHEKDHVLGELRAYASLVSPGSYIVAMDGIMQRLVGAPRTGDDWSWNNPIQAALQFVNERDDFVIEEPGFEFNEGSVDCRVTYWPCGYLRRKHAPSQSSDG